MFSLQKFDEALSVRNESKRTATGEDLLWILSQKSCSVGEWKRKKRKMIRRRMLRGWMKHGVGKDTDAACGGVKLINL